MLELDIEATDWLIKKHDLRRVDQSDHESTLSLHAHWERPVARVLMVKQAHNLEKLFLRYNSLLFWSSFVVDSKEDIEELWDSELGRQVILLVAVAHWA